MGKPANIVYSVCEACQLYACGLSARGWCPKCEAECKRIGKLAREKLERMRSADQHRTELQREHHV